MALLDKQNDKWNKYIRKQEELKWEEEDRREQKRKERKLRWENVPYRRRHTVYPMRESPYYQNSPQTGGMARAQNRRREQRRKDEHPTAMP